VAVKFSDNDHVGIFERYGVPSISRHVIQEIVAQRHVASFRALGGSTERASLISLIKTSRFG
jgi:hypothetical protein